MSNTLVTEIVEHLEILPLNLQNHVLAIVRVLSRSFRTEVAETSFEMHSDNLENHPQKTAGQRVVKFAGTISPSDLDLMSLAIEEDCGKVDIDEW